MHAADVLPWHSASRSSTTAWATCARCPRRWRTWRRCAAWRSRRQPARTSCGADRVVFPGPGRDARLHARNGRVAACARRCSRRRRRKPLPGHLHGHADAVRAQRRRRYAGPGHVPGQVVRFRARRPRCSRTAALQGAAHGLEPGVAGQAPHPLWAGMEDGSRFYFVHSYYVEPADAAAHSAARTRLSPFAFTCGHGADNIFAMQFHPEKSADRRLDALLGNFCTWNALRFRARLASPC